MNRITLILLIVITACSKDTELKKSIFIDDPVNPGLPEYSEWGYNTFGAYYDRQIFISNDLAVPLKVIVSNDSTTLLFSGQLGASTYYSDGEAGMSMRLTIPGYAPADYSGLISLDDSIMDLSKPDYRVEISIDSSDYQANILDGQLEIKRAQKLLVDKEQVEVILSGYFNFRALIKNEPVSVTEGRFDVGIGKDNFFNIPAK